MGDDLGDGRPFLLKKYLFRKKNKIIFFGSGKFSKHVKKVSRLKSISRNLISNFKHFIGIYQSEKIKFDQKKLTHILL